MCETATFRSPLAGRAATLAAVDVNCRPGGNLNVLWLRILVKLNKITVREQFLLLTHNRYQDMLCFATAQKRPGGPFAEDDLTDRCCQIN